MYACARFLLLKLPRRDEAGALDLGNDVALEYYRLSRTGAGSIGLGGDAESLKGPTEVGTGGAHEPVKERLSTIISILNERFGTDFTQADQLAFEQIEEELVANEELAEQARVNSIDNYKYEFEDAFTDAVIDRKAQNEEIFTRILDDGDFASAVKAYLMQKVYERQNGSSP